MVEVFNSNECHETDRLYRKADMLDVSVSDLVENIVNLPVSTDEMSIIHKMRTDKDFRRYILMCTEKHANNKDRESI